MGTNRLQDPKTGRLPPGSSTMGHSRELFLEANSEHLVVFAKLQPFIAEIRETIGEPDYLAHLEQLVMNVPNIEKKLENRRKLIAGWAMVRAAPVAQGA